MNFNGDLTKFPGVRSNVVAYETQWLAKIENIREQKAGLTISGEEIATKEIYRNIPEHTAESF